MSADEATRVRQSVSASTSPDVLRMLASDPSVTVRASLALNPALPDCVSAILAEDTDARVRAILNRKLSTLTPNLSNDDRQRVQRDAVANLTAMVADAALRVRISLAEAVKDLPDGPRDIVLRLAHDPAVMVCEPVIRFSPMLTDEDLVALIAARPPASTVMAVARRPKIAETVSDAIVDNADVAAIGALLANPTAQIREATLDSLAAQSEEHTDWQAPLVRRPHLSQRAQRMLSEIVSGHLLETLSARADLDPKIAQSLRSVLKPPRPRATSEIAADETRALMQARVRQLHAAGRVSDETILSALSRNATAEAAAMLAAKAEVPAAVIDRACALRSAKGIVSLAWKAGLKVETAATLQVALAQLPPDKVLRATANGDFPLSESEMHWHLTFLDLPDRTQQAWTPRRLAPNSPGAAPN